MPGCAVESKYSRSVSCPLRDSRCVYDDDADMAKESVGMTKNQMLVQSGIGILKQTSQMPQMIMGLMG